MRKILTALFVMCIVSCFARDGVPAEQGTNVAHIILGEHTLAYDKYHTYSATTSQKYAWPNYVQDGLIHMWDGILNTGKDTHKDGDIPYWKDVIGDLDLMITSTNIYFTGNSLYMPFLGSSRTNRVEGIARSTDSITDEKSYITVEVCVSNNDGSYNYFPNRTMQSACIFNSSATRYSSSTASWYSPFFLATDGYSTGWYMDNFYKLFLAKTYDGSMRMVAYNYSNSSKYIRGQFTLSFENSSRDYTTSTSYCQPYNTSVLTIYSFGDSITSYNTTTNAYKKYDMTGKIKSPYAYNVYAGNYLTIGGIKGSTSAMSPVIGRSYECLFWNGHIYCVRIYNRKLTAEEKLSNYEVDYRRFYDQKVNNQ